MTTWRSATVIRSFAAVDCLEASSVMQRECLVPKKTSAAAEVAAARNSVVVLADVEEKTIGSTINWLSTYFQDLLLLVFDWIWWTRDDALHSWL